MLRRSIQSLRRFMLDRMVLQPSRYPIDFYPQTRSMLRSRGRPLECFVRTNYRGDQAAELLVLKFPGTAGRAERAGEFPVSILEDLWREQDSPDLRTAIWTWNPPGYGRSQGMAGLQRTAEAARDFWTQVTRHVADDSTIIWLCGNSLGCVSALHVAATMQPESSRSGIILRNPPALKRVVKRVSDKYPLGRFVSPIIDSLCDSMNVMSTAPQVRLPAVFLQSELDALVPLEYQNEVIEAYAGPRRVVVMEGLGHSGMATEIHEPLIQDSIAWLWQQTGCKANESYSQS